VVGGGAGAVLAGRLVGRRLGVVRVPGRCDGVTDTAGDGGDGEEAGGDGLGDLLASGVALPERLGEVAGDPGEP
jgi:hypothetical protein